MRETELVSDTWTFDGRSCTEVHTFHSPGPRAHATMLLSPPHRGLVLLGGEGNGTTHADSWVFEGDDWRRVVVRTP